MPIVFLHGYGVDHRTFLPCEDVFTDDEPWQRIYVDLPGFGGSPAEGTAPNADAFLALIERFVDNRIDSRFAVVGNSFGAQLARHLVGAFRDRVVGAAFFSPVLVDPRDATLPEKVFPRSNRELRDRLDPVERALFRANAMDQSWGAWDRFARCVLPGLQVYDREFGELLRASFVPVERVEYEKGSVDIPALLITGRQDTIVGWSDQQILSRTYTRMDNVVLDACGHNPHVDRPVAFDSCFREWVRRVAAELRS
nr:alpha/beta hydrolase [Nocardia bovistercoris]